jgi:hypothetical protein
MIVNKRNIISIELDDSKSKSWSGSYVPKSEIIKRGIFRNEIIVEPLSIKIIDGSRERVDFSDVHDFFKWWDTNGEKLEYYYEVDLQTGFIKFFEKPSIKVTLKIGDGITVLRRYFHKSESIGDFYDSLIGELRNNSMWVDLGELIKK